MPSNYLEPIQTRIAPPSPYEAKLAAALEEIFGRGTHDLQGLLAELSDAGVSSPSGGRWTESSFMAEMRRLGV